MEAPSTRSDQAGQQEKLKILAIFPKEIWLLISDVILDLNDLANLSQASPFWRNMLEYKQQEFLFPQILQVLIQRQFMAQNKWSSELLVLRQVCKSWNTGVNRYLEAGTSHGNLSFTRLQHDLMESDASYPKYFRTNANNVAAKLTTEIIPRLESNIRNPFPSRHLEICEQNFEYELDSLENLVNHRVTIEKFLRLAGHHFWYATISIGVEMEISDWYSLICKYVQLLPNLKSLYITYIRFNFCRNAGDAGILTNYGNPFPTLNCLEVLSLETVPETFANKILASNRQVKVLIIPTMFHRVCSHGPYGRKCLPKIPPPTINYSLIERTEVASILFPTSKSFTGLPSTWDLRELRVAFVDNPPVIWKGIFQKLETYKDTLRKLYVEFPMGTSLKQKFSILESSKRPLDLPKLQHFAAVIRNHSSLDFLLGLKSLEHLSLSFELDYAHAWMPKRDLGTDLINFNWEFLEGFMQCNIWELVKTLWTVSITKSGGIRKYRRRLS